MTSQILRPIRTWASDIWRLWDQFFFTPAAPETLGLIRILAGAMLLYTHFVWTLDLETFFGVDGWLSRDFVTRFHDSPFGWSHLYWVDGGLMLWTCHLLALAVFVCLMIGFKTRVSSVAAFLLTVGYAHRAAGALFGLDQINGFLALYLMVGPAGHAFSVDNWLRKRRGAIRPATASVSANVAIRLMQLHLCIVYLFAGLGKLLGESWWDGTALWGAFGNQEYQTLDMTWVAHSIVLVNVITHVTLFWEISYCALVWHRLTRPVILALAVPLHLGIAMCMGMVTFGVIMLIANLAFVPPAVVRSCAACIVPRQKDDVSVETPTTWRDSRGGSKRGRTKHASSLKRT